MATFGVVTALFFGVMAGTTDTALPDAPGPQPKSLAFAFGEWLFLLLCGAAHAAFYCLCYPAAAAYTAWGAVYVLGHSVGGALRSVCAGFVAAASGA